MKSKLIALKAYRYSTRKLSPGDLFEATANDARLLVALGKAREHTQRDEVRLEPPPAALAARMQAAAGGSPNPADLFGASPDDLTALRRQYFEALGKRPFPGWDAAALRAKIAAAPTA